MGTETLAGRLERERQRTDALIADLRQELAAIAESTAAGPDDEHDAEGSTVAYERARVQGLLARAEHTAQEIESAVLRTRAHVVVWCQRCPTPIPPERLEALPTTRICVACAAALT